RGAEGGGSPVVIAVLEDRKPVAGAEREALRLLFQLARSATPGGHGDVYVGRQRVDGDLYLEAWAREIDPLAGESRIPPRLRADATDAAVAVGGRLEVEPDARARKL